MQNLNLKVILAVFFIMIFIGSTGLAETITSPNGEVVLTFSLKLP